MAYLGEKKPQQYKHPSYSVLLIICLHFCQKTGFIYLILKYGNTNSAQM